MAKVVRVWSGMSDDDIKEAMDNIKNRGTSIMCKVRRLEAEGLEDQKERYVSVARRLFGAGVVFSKIRSARMLKKFRPGGIVSKAKNHQGNGEFIINRKK